MDNLITELSQKLEKTVESFAGELAKVRTGRAHAELLDHIKVDSYGSKMPLSQVASVSVEGARGLTVSPWDKSLIKACEKAIRQSDPSLNPASHGDYLRIQLPELNEERRKEMTKLARDLAEHSKVAVRNIRRATMTQIKNQLKEKTITEDDERRLESQVNKTTEQYIEKIAGLCSAKETELLAV